MRQRLIGLIFILAGVGLLASPLYIRTEDGRVYVYPSDAQVEAYHGIIQSSDSRLLIDGCSVPHTTLSIEVSEAEAKRMREEAGFSSEGVSGGVIVEFNQTGPCQYGPDGSQ